MLLLTIMRCIVPSSSLLDDVGETALKLHEQFGYISADRLSKLLKSADIRKPDLESEIVSVTEKWAMLFFKVCPHGRTVSVGQTLLLYHKAKEDDVISVETRKVDIVANSGTR